jgi:hypothetical protein
MPRRFLVLGLVAVLVGLTAAKAPTTLARLTGQGTSTYSMSTDTLAPPTGLAASGPTIAALTWTASNDAYAAGYQVLRSTTSGSGYALVKTVTPGSSTSTTDSPGNGVFYYVLRSSFQNWLSVNSNEASVALGQTSTGYMACTAASNAADTGGNGDGYEVTAGSACADGGSNAVDTASGTNTVASCANTGKDRHRWWDFGLGVPGTVASVDGIALRADFGMNNNGGTTLLCAQLSWDGGTNWTAIKSITPTGAAETTYTFGGAADAWGHAWTGSQLSNGNFRVRIIDASSQSNKDFRLDYLAVNVTYTP